MDQHEVNEKLRNLSGWKFENNSIIKEYERKDFVDSVSSLMKIAVEAEKMDHHPDVSIHSYNKLRIVLTTHSKGGVTADDFELAGRIEKVIS